MQWEFCLSQLTSQWEGCKPKCSSLATHCFTTGEGERLQTVPVSWKITETNQKTNLRGLLGGFLLMSCSLCAPGMRRALWDVRPVNMGKSLAFSLSQSGWASKPGAFPEPWRLHHSLPLFSLWCPRLRFSWLQDTARRSKCEGSCVRCLLRTWHCCSKINGNTSKDKGSDFQVVWSFQWRKPVSEML